MTDPDGRQPAGERRTDGPPAGRGDGGRAADRRGDAPRSARGAAPRGDGPRAPRGDAPGRDAPRRDAPRDNARRGAGPQAGAARSGGQGSRAEPARRAPRRTDGARPLAVPDDADPRLLADDVREELRSLTPDNADRVARHLVAAGMLLDDDPETALAHARAARVSAGRLAAVREAVGIAAYRAGQWQEALSELRAARRISGDVGQLPVMADCERGLGRPERALTFARSTDVARLSGAARIEMRIVEAGARRDLGQADAALLVLQDAGVNSAQQHEWTPRLWYAYADTLLALGRRREARDWLSRIVATDDLDQTDAADRLQELDDEDDPAS